MSSPDIKINVVPKPIIKGKMDVRFPAKVEVENFLTLTKANGVYTFGVDYTKLVASGITDPSTAQVAFLDASNNVYKVASIADILSGVGKPDDLAEVAFTGDYDDLSNKPALGTAAFAATTDFATAAQGATADSAVQPGDIGTAAAQDVGTAAGNVVQLDGSAKLPAIDGSQLTNLPVVSGGLAAANNLSDVANVDTSLDNLGASTVGKAVLKAANATVARGNIGAASWVRASVANILAQRAGSNAFLQFPDGLCDAMQDTTGIDAAHSLNWTYSTTYKEAGPFRPYNDSVAYEPFDNLTSWTTTGTSGNGSVTIYDPSDPDPAVGSCVRFATGASGVANINRTFSSIPRNFGISIFPRIEAAVHPLDALYFTIENVDNLSLQLRFYQDKVDLYQDGVWKSLDTHSTSAVNFRETWVEWKYNSSTSQTVSLYLGTEFIASLTGQCPAGTGTNGKCTITLTSGAHGLRIVSLASLAIGSTQLPSDMSLVGADRTVPGGFTSGWVVALIEYIAGEPIAINTDFTLSLAPNGHGTYEQITLVDGGRAMIGSIDPAKWVHVVYGEINFAGSIGTVVKSLLNTFNGKYVGVLGLTYGVY